MKTTRNSVLMILLIVIVMVLVIGLVACDNTTTDDTPKINRNYVYRKAGYEAANGNWVTIDIVGWRLDDSGFIELTQENNRKILVHSTKVVLYTTV